MTNVRQGPWSVDSGPGSSVADAAEPPYHGPMNSPTREELDAKLEAMEARMDGRVSAIQGSIDAFIGRMEERSLRTDDRFGRMDDRMGGIESSLKETQQSIGNLKSTIIITAISTVLAIVLGVAAFNATVLSNMVASFESGKSTSAAQAEVKRQSEETAALLRQLQKQLDTTAPQTPAATAPVPK